MKAYKAFKVEGKKLFTGGIGRSKKTEWKVGDRKTVEGEPVLCQNGFHYFDHLCFGIGMFGKSTGFCEVEIHGSVVGDTVKKVTNDIEIVRYIPKKEWHKLIDKNRNSGYGNSGDWNSGYRNSGNGNSGDGNSGDGNSGYRNSGNRNSGNGNSGDWNSGYRNSGNGNSGNRNFGDENSGDGNSGYRNSGYRNSGNGNSGDENSGDGNSGYRNSGNGNSGDFNSGNGYKNFFCTKTKNFLFDEPCKESTIQKLKRINFVWFDVRGKTYKAAWAECPEEVLAEFRAIPEFRQNKKKFKEITGLDL